MVHQSKGEKEEVVRHFKTALRIVPPFNWHDVLFPIHYNMAEAFLDEDEFDEAIAHIEQAKPFAVDNIHWLGCAIFLQAHVWYRQRRFEDAKSEGLHALKIFEKLNAARDARSCRNHLQ
jgi:tetratricopeptide (TPR) repeat protein